MVFISSKRSLTHQIILVSTKVWSKRRSVRNWVAPRSSSHPRVGKSTRHITDPVVLWLRSAHYIFPHSRRESSSPSESPANTTPLTHIQGKLSNHRILGQTFLSMNYRLSNFLERDLVTLAWSMGQVVCSLLQTNTSSPSHTLHRHTPTLSVAYPLTCDAAATTSPDSQSMPLVHQWNVDMSSRSMSHSPLQANIHHRMTTIPTSPSLPSDPASHSGASTPSSTSVPPHPLTHHVHTRSPRGIRHHFHRCQGPNLTDHKLCRGMGYHWIASNPITVTKV